MCVGWTVYLSICKNEGGGSLMLLTVSGLQGCDLVQGSDTAVDEVIKRSHCGCINKHGHMRTRTLLPH